MANETSDTGDTSDGSPGADGTELQNLRGRPDQVDEDLTIEGPSISGNSARNNQAQIAGVAAAAYVALGFTLPDGIKPRALNEKWSVEGLSARDVDVIASPVSLLSPNGMRINYDIDPRKLVFNDQGHKDRVEAHATPAEDTNNRRVRRAAFLREEDARYWMRTVLKFVSDTEDWQTNTSNQTNRIPEEICNGIQYNPFWWMESDGVNKFDMKGQMTYVSLNSEDSRTKQTYSMSWWHFFYLAWAAPERHPLFTGHVMEVCSCFLDENGNEWADRGQAEGLPCGRTAHPRFTIDFIQPRTSMDGRHYMMWAKRGLVRAQFQFRYFVPSKKTWEAATSSQEEHDEGMCEFSFGWGMREGIKLKRQLAKLNNKTIYGYISERVVSVVVYSRSLGPFSRWGITILAEDGLWDDSFEDLARSMVDCEQIWQKQGQVKPNFGTGMHGEVIFQAMIISAFLQVEKQWNRTLDAIQRIAGIKLSDFFSDEKLDDYMFDRTFKRSRDYFSALQLLRLVDEWIDENLDEIEKCPAELRAEMLRCVGFALQFDTETEFKATLAIISQRSESLKKRVANVREEITSLRDGLFNATSLREATRGTSLNTAIYLFTVITILYTPIGFLATFWALPWLSSPSDPDEKVTQPSQFLATMVVVPLVTYLIVAGCAWYFWPGGSNQARVKLWVAAALKETTQRVAKLGHLASSKRRQTDPEINSTR